MDDNAYERKSRVKAKESESSHDARGSHEKANVAIDDDPESAMSGLLETGADREGAPSAEMKECESALNQREKELSELHDRLLRNQAEFENYKKRMAREKAGMLKFGNESLMRELLPVIDNLDLFLAHASTARTIKGMVEGIEIVRKELVRKLETFGLKSIAAQGEKFDPDKHEAVSQVETSEYPEDTVVSELQRGYSIHERLLRPAKVIVAKTPTPHSPEAEL